MACEIVAELSNAANGSYDRMLRLMDAAKAAGADTLKIQAYTVAELVSLRGNGPAPAPWNHMTMEELYTKAQTPLTWIPGIFAHAKDIGMPIFSSVFGAESLACLEAVGCPRYKVAHLDWGSESLANLLRPIGKPLVVSYPSQWSPSHTGPVEFIGQDTWWGIPCRNVYCPGGYPATLEEMHLTSNIWGLSSHCTHPLVAPLAIARGAQYLEYHMMLREEPSELESSVSLDQYEFSEMVKSVRDAEVLLS